jgi:hypothetical protein
VVFESRRRIVMTEPEVRVAAAPEDSWLREEPDPDPLIEAMVQRLREGLGTLSATDEWGRPLSWRNVVRMAVGPMHSRLRDLETAAALAAELVPATEDAGTPEPVAEVLPQPAPATVAEVLPEPEPEPAPAAVPYGSVSMVSRPYEDVTLDVAAAEPVAEVVPEPVEEVVAQVEPEAPAAPSPVPQPAAVPPAPTSPAPASAVSSIFAASGDQRAVAVSPFGSRQLPGRGGPDDSTAAKYDRFLTSLYGERQQAPGDEDRHHH